MNNNKLFDKYGDSPLSSLCDYLFFSSSDGNLEEVKYLLTSPDLKCHPPIDFYHDNALYVSTKEGHIPIIEYFLNFPGYGTQVKSNYALIKASLHNQLETVKFLLDSDTIPFKANIHAEEDYVFRELMMAKNEEILQYLIFDRNLPKTKHIEEYLNRDNYNLNGFALAIKGWFDSRELQKELNTDLPNSNQSNKKIKI